MNLILTATWKDFISSTKEKDDIILFGGSSCANIYINKLKSRPNIKYVIDNDLNKIGKLCCDYDVYGPEKLSEATTNDILLITSTYYDEIIKQLDSLDFKGTVYSFLHLRNKIISNDFSKYENNIYALKSILADDKSKDIVDTIIRKRIENSKDYSDIYETNQYFVDGIITPDENEVFIDGGSFDGDTVRKLIKFENNSFKQILSFEMDKKNYNLINAQDYDERVKFYNYGLWNKNETISFIENAQGSEVNEDGNSAAECISLDKFVTEKVTFIKMDIEGAELKALSGAEKIITKDKPKLAICLYHKQNDLWEIPLYIKSLVPDYKIYIRHHGKNNEETVMYAVI